MRPAARWQVGVDIQQDRLLAVAVQHRRYGWQLRGWWEWLLPHHSQDDAQLPPESDVVSALVALRKTLPGGYRLRVGIPTGRTLQQQLALPAMALSDAETHRYIGQMAAQQLDMPVSQLCWDYGIHSGSQLACVTTAPAEEVSRLQRYFTQSRCQLAAITPDALALAPYRIQQADSVWVIYRGQQDWLWYGPHQWGATRCSDVAGIGGLLERLGCPMTNALVCEPQTAILAQPEDRPQERLDPYSVLQLVAPPLPEDIGPFVIALGLALGSYPA